MEKISEILRKHKLWLKDEDGGERANLCGANLGYADLSGADLSGANLRGAYLRGADLSGANLRGASLSEASLRCADLRGADLSGANLSCADLSDAKLSGANLSEANLRRVASGNNSEILTVQTGEWIIVYTPVCMAIGCQQHSLSEWWSFSDDQIAEMDKRALDFWRKWRPILRQIMGLTSDTGCARAE